MRLTTKIAIATTTTALFLGATLAIAPYANASVSQGYVYGAGWGDAVNDDFGDEGPVDYNSHRYSNATAMWQMILQSDGFYSGAIDCDFGPATTAATRAWQDFFGRGALAVDGSAGPKTWGFADQWLIDKGNSRDIGYVGNVYSLTFRRVNGIYQIYLNGAWRNATYNSASC